MGSLPSVSLIAGALNFTNPNPNSNPYSNSNPNPNSNPTPNPTPNLKCP